MKIKKTIFLICLLFYGLVSYADYTGTVTTATTDLSFSTYHGYDVVSFTDGFYSSQIGAPQLPVKILKILIPIDQAISTVSITSTSSVTIAGTYTICPLQPVVTNDTLPFVNPDTSIYNHSTPYPSILYQVTNDEYPMGYHVVTITFFPVQYIPTSHTLNLFTSINFTIVYASNTASIIIPKLQSLYSSNLAKSYIQGIVVNPSDISIVTGGARQVIDSSTQVSNLRGMSPTSLISVPSYVIITRSDLVGDATHGFQMLANWKIQKGINTIIVTTDGTNGIYNNYQGFDNAEKIRNYLKDVYSNFGVVFVLLGGDVIDDSYAELIPARKTPVVLFIKASDFYYSTVQGNWNSNGNSIFGEDGGACSNLVNELTQGETSRTFFVGRAPSQNLTDATNFANKIINYETLNNTTTKSYVRNLSFWINDCATTTIPPFNCNGACVGPIGPGRSNGSDCGATISSELSSTWLTSYSSTALKLYYSLTSANQLTHNNAISALNSQYHMIYHADHSDFDNLGSSSVIGQGLKAADMDGLTNTNYNNIIYSDGCVSAGIETNSVSKHYINNPTGGGVAFSGASDENPVNAYSTALNYFFKPLYYPGTWNSLTTYDNARYHIGITSSYGSFGVEFGKLRTLFGDPEMMVWTDTPNSLTQSSSYSSSSKQITCAVSGLPSSSSLPVTVTVWKGTEIWSTLTYTTTSSSHTFIFNNVVAITTGDIIVTVTAHNYLPNVGTISVHSPVSSGPLPNILTQTIIDNGTVGSIGNGDGFPDAGETIAFPITIINSGNAVATNVSAELIWTPPPTLSACSTMVTVNATTSPHTFGNIIASGGTANNNSSPFLFTIDKAAFDCLPSPRPLTYFMNFTLKIYINGVLFSANPFYVQMGEPNLIMGENKVTLSGTPPPPLYKAGSHNLLTINLYNIGLSQATGLNATLSLHATDPNINIYGTATKAYSNINGANSTTSYASNSSAFTFSMVTTGYNTSETFDLTVTNTFGRTWTFSNFYLMTPLSASFTEFNTGNLTSININWTCSISAPSGDAILGYNLKRRKTLVGGAYTRINNYLIPYSCFLDDGQGVPLDQLTSYDYQLTVVDINGNESAPYSFSASTSLPLHLSPVWPKIPSENQPVTGGRLLGSPNVYDLYDGINGIKGNKEIFFTSGDFLATQGGLWGYHHDGSRWYTGFDADGTDNNGLISYGCGSPATPFIADINNDGTAEVGVTTHSDGTIPSGNGNKLFVYKILDANTAPTAQPTSFPITLSTPYDIMKGAVISDLDKDGKMEVLTNDNFGGGLQVFGQNGSAFSGWTIPGSTYYNGFSTPVAFDFDNDGKKEIVIGCTGTHSGIYIYKKDGTAFNTNPIYVTSTDRHDYPPVIADLNNDGNYEIIFTSTDNSTSANIYAFTPTPSGNTFLTGWNSSSHPSFSLNSSAGNNSSTNVSSGQNCPSLSAGDINKDGLTEVVSVENGIINVWGNGGTSTPLTYTTFPYPSSFTSPPAVNYQAPILADVDNDNSDLEIVFNAAATSSSGTNIFAFKPTAIHLTPVVGFPIFIADDALNSPCIDNIDEGDKQDQENELIVTTVSNFYVWDTKGDASNNIYGWNSYRKDNYNSGVYYDMFDGFLYDEDIYLQNKTNVGSNATNHYRYFFGRNVSVGTSVTGKITNGAISFDATSNIIIEATNGVLLQADVAIPVGCIFEIK